MRIALIGPASLRAVIGVLRSSVCLYPGWRERRSLLGEPVRHAREDDARLEDEQALDIERPLIAEPGRYVEFMLVDAATELVIAVDIAKRLVSPQRLTFRACLGDCQSHDLASEAFNFNGLIGRRFGLE